MRQFVNQLSDGQPVDDVYQVIDKQLRPNRQGNLYLQLRLSDRTGWVTAMLWNASESMYQKFPLSGYVSIQGNAQVYNGNMQLILKSVHSVTESEVDVRDFQATAKSDVEGLMAQLKSDLGSFRSPALRALADAFLEDTDLMDRFALAPAGVSNHHAYHGGLLEHVVNLIKVCKSVADFYPTVDNDLLVMGAFLHDLGKVRELTYEGELGYSDEGQLLGHVLIVLEILAEKIKAAEKKLGEPLDREMVLRVKHMIASHHGQYEYGSPRLPMTPEAMTLHLLDNLDAKIHNFQQIMEDDLNSESSWTTFQPSLERKLFKGSRK